MIGFALVGAGFIGPVHAANIAAHGRASLRWVVDLNLDAATQLATRHGATATARLDQALADREVTAVVICTPPRTHASIIETVAAAGKAILCEKPIDLDMAQIDRCRRAVEAAGVPFQVGFNRRFDPTHAALRDALRRGDIGRLEMLLLSSRDPEISPPDYVAAMPYGIFYDTMIHDFDMLRWITGDEPVEIHARTACMLDAAENPHRDPDTAMVTLRMAGGTLVHVNASFRAVYGYDQRIEAFGAKGMLVSGNQRATSLERHDRDGTRKDPLLYFFIDRYARSYAAELDAFVHALETNTAPAVSFDDGRRALMIAEAGVRAAKTGAPVALES